MREASSTIWVGNGSAAPNPSNMALKVGMTKTSRKITTTTATDGTYIFTGISGGGAATYWVTAADDRVAAARPDLDPRRAQPGESASRDPGIGILHRRDHARNPGFDVTPAEMVTGIITPLGIFKPRQLWSRRLELGCNKR